MRRVPLRRLAVPTAAAPDRICFHGLWFAGHNNARYSELLPRLERIDALLVPIPERQPFRAAAYRAARAFRRAADPAVLSLASRRYRAMLAVEARQMELFSGGIVADMDDPPFRERDAAALGRGNVRAFVVTDERAARRYEALGVDKPWYVVPQGVGTPSEEGRREARAARAGTPLVVGYVAAWLLLDGDRGGSEPLYNVAHLLELWDELRPRIPGAKLWLVGGASARVRRRLAGRDDVMLFGRLPRDRALAHVEAFDVALYPRTRDQGIRSAKVGEYLGFGVPTVSYDYEVTSELRDTGGGVLVGTPREFVAAVERLATDEAERSRVAAAAAAAGRGRSWDVLAQRFAEILDRHLPR